MSTQDRAIRGEGAAEHDGGEREGEAAAGGTLEPGRLRAMQRRWIQRKAGGGGGGGGGAAAAIPGGPGAALGGGVQSKMERTLGADLSAVRVHTGGDSAEAAESLGARAFTVGSDVHFGRGEFAPGSKEGDRLLAHELTHVVQGQKSGVQRKPAGGGEAAGGEHGDHEAGGHEVSEPGDAAEHEADAMGDHAADALHGGGGAGGAHAGGEHGAAGGEHGGGDAKAAGASSAAPAMGGGEGKKISRKPKINAAAPDLGRKIYRAPKPGAQAGGAKTPATGAPPAAAASATPQKPKEELAKEKRVAEATADMAAIDAGDPKLALKVALALQTVDKDVATFPQNEAVKAFKVFVNARKQLIIDKCQEEMAPLIAALDGIDEKSPASADKLAELKKSPVMEKWSRNSICGPYTKDKHPRLELFNKTLDKKLHANADALEKQKQHQKEEEEKKKVAAAGPGPATATGGATPAGAGAHKPAGGANAALPAVQATAAPTPGATAKPDAKPDVKTSGAHTPPSPAAPATTASSAATTSTAAPHKDTPAAHPQGAPPTSAATGAPPAAATTTTATPAAAHAPHAPAEATGPAPQSTSTPASTTASTPQTPAAAPQGAQPAANQADELKKQELQLKKEVALTRVRTALASTEDKWKIFGAALEVLNIGAMLAKGFLASHGIELPEEAMSILKDSIGSIGKSKLTKAQIDGLFAVIEIQGIETVDEIDALFAEADSAAAASQLMRVSKRLSQEEALKQEALALMAKAKPKGPDKKSHEPAGEKHAEKENESEESKDESSSSSASDSDKSKDKDSKAKDGKKGFGHQFKHAAEETYEKGVKGPVEAESELEEKNPDIKIAAQQFGNVLDPAKTVVALGDVLKSHFKDLKLAKQAQADAEKALAAFLAEHGGKQLPNYAAPIPGA